MAWSFVMLAGLSWGASPAERPSSGLYPFSIQAELPDPAAATVLSGIVGFGAGHFYAEEPKVGAAVLGTELIGLGLCAAGRSRFANADDLGGLWCSPPTAPAPPRDGRFRRRTTGRGARP